MIRSAFAALASWRPESLVLGHSVQQSRAPMEASGDSEADSVTDSKASREKSIDEWLPVTASRKAKWWYSAFHNVNAIVGAGVLGLPYAMSELGWGPGVAALITSWVLTLYTLWQLVQMHEAVPGKRFDRYHELGQYAFGEKLGLWIVVPQQLLVQVNVNILYMVTGGKSLQKFHETVCQGCRPITYPCFVLIFASVHFALAQLPSLNSISAISLAGAVMSVCYSTVAWVASLGHGRQADVDYRYRQFPTTGSVFSFFNALGSVAFAYAGHTVVLEVQASMPSTPEKPSKGPMWKGALTAYIIVAICYFPVSLFGYYVFANEVNENILMSIKDQTWVVAMAHMMVAVHLIGSYQLHAVPVFDMIEAFLTKTVEFPPDATLRLVSRSIYVAFTMFTAIAFPSYNGLQGFFGGILTAPAHYFLPCIMWLAIYKPRRYSLTWFSNWICIVHGVILMIISPIGGVWKIANPN